MKNSRKKQSIELSKKYSLQKHVLTLLGLTIALIYLLFMGLFGSNILKHLISLITVNEYLLIALYILVFIIIGAFIFYHFQIVRSAVYGWVQTDWSGGASTTAVALHPGDETGWTNYYSKDDVISTSTPGEISLSSTTASWVETTDADFNAGTFANTYASSSAVWLKKPTGVSCSYGAECTGGYCNASSSCGVCENFTYSSQTYAVVMIGEQCWMAENLNVGDYATSTDTGSAHSDVSDNSQIEKYCYSNDTDNCGTDGGLYDWNEMMAYVTTEGAQGICPTGWHIPTDAEWYTLENGLATESCSASRTGWECAPAGANLKENGNTGFEALLAGYRRYHGHFYSRGSGADFWSSSESGGSAWRRGLYSGDSAVGRLAYNKTNGFSVRCLKD